MNDWKNMNKVKLPLINIFDKSKTNQNLFRKIKNYFINKKMKK